MAKYDARLNRLVKHMPVKPFDFELLIESPDGTFTGENGKTYTEAALDHETTMIPGDADSIAGVVRKWKAGELTGRAKGFVTKIKGGIS